MPEFQIVIAALQSAVTGGKHPAGPRPTFAQNVRICGKSTSRADGQLTVQNGGSARGYQPGLRVVGLPAAVTGHRRAHPPTVYLCIGALGAIVRICRVEVRRITMHLTVGAAAKT